MIEILEQEKCPEWVRYPESYLKLIKEEKDTFLPWYLTNKEDVIWRFAGLKERYPKRKLFPFARRDYNDDIACWEKDFGEQVIVMHDFTDPGWERRKIFRDFNTWHEWALRQKDDESSDGDEGFRERGYSISEIKILKEQEDPAWKKG